MNVNAWDADELYAAIVQLRRKRLRAGGRAVVLSFAEAVKLERALTALAKLASTQPEFMTPIEAWNAQTLREHVLDAARRGVNG